MVSPLLISLILLFSVRSIGEDAGHYVWIRTGEFVATVKTTAFTERWTTCPSGKAHVPTWEWAGMNFPPGMALIGWWTDYAFAGTEPA